MVAADRKPKGNTVQGRPCVGTNRERTSEGLSYLSVQNFWKFQNADVWKKSVGHPPWCKLFVHRDMDIDELPYEARLLFYELLAAATRYSNVLKADVNWLASETRMDAVVIAEMLPLLLKGAWLSETKGARRSRKPSRVGAREDPLDLKEEEKEEIRTVAVGEAVPAASPGTNSTGRIIDLALKRAAGE